MDKCIVCQKRTRKTDNMCEICDRFIEFHFDMGLIINIDKKGAFHFSERKDLIDRPFSLEYLIPKVLDEVGMLKK